MARKVKAPRVRLVRNREDRKRPSVYHRLKTDESFKAHAMFEPDPELENNPGYLEYFGHWSQEGGGFSFVPCAGDQCPFCHANDNPSTRALTVWFFPDAEKGEQLKIFEANWGTINALTDEAEDEDGIIGRKMRIKRLTDKGEYRIKLLSEKPLTKSEVKKLMPEIEELDLEGKIDHKLKVEMERLSALDALEDDDDDDDDDEEDEPKPRRGKAVAEAEEDDDDEDEEEEEDDEDEEDEEEESEEDEDEDDDEEDEEEDEEEEAEAISAASYEVVSVDAGAETIDLKNDDGKVKMWFGADVEWEEDELTKGTTVEISAQTDDEGDWVITALEVMEAKPKPKRGRPKGSTSKTKAKTAPKGKGRGKAKK